MHTQAHRPTILYTYHAYVCTPGAFWSVDLDIRSRVYTCAQPGLRFNPDSNLPN